MSGTTTTAALAAILALATPVALAQATTATTPTATAPGAPAAAAQSAAPAIPTGNRLLPRQVRFTDINGAPVYDGHNKNLGDIAEVVFERNGRVAAIVLDVGSFLGIGGKHVAVSLHDLRITSDDTGKPRFQVDMTRDQLKSSQAFDLSPRNASTGSSGAPAGPPRIDGGR